MSLDESRHRAAAKTAKIGLKASRRKAQECTREADDAARERKRRMDIRHDCACVARRRIADAGCARTAGAETTLRVGKAQPKQFAFVPADIGVEAGIFKKHGVDVEISSFGGDAKMMQALAAGSIDIALGGGPAFATIVKGVADEGRGRARQRAEHHHAGGAEGRADQDRRRSQGQEGQRLDRRLADLLADDAAFALEGLGHRRHQDRPARRRRGADRGAEDQPDRRRHHRQRHRLQSRRSRAAAASW